MVSMKFFALPAVMLLFVAMQSFGEFSLGINLHTNSSVTLPDGADETFNSQSYSIQPTFIVMLSDIFELVPSAGFSIRTQKGIGANKAATFPGFNVGLGFFFRVIRRDVFRCSLGPQPFYSMTFDNNNDNDQFDLYTGIGVPINIDLRLTQRFFFRTSFDLLNATFHRRSPGYGNFSTNFITYGSLSGGFFLTF